LSTTTLWSFTCGVPAGRVLIALWQPLRFTLPIRIALYDVIVLVKGGEVTAPGHTTGRSPLTVLHGVYGKLGVVEVLLGSQHSTLRALMCFFPTFKVVGCLEWMASSSRTGACASTIGIPSHALNRCVGIHHKFPTPCTQTFAHPLPMLCYCDH